MRIALICDLYPPSRTSVAVQMRDLAREFAAQGHEPVVLAPIEGPCPAWLEQEESDGVRVVRLRAPGTKDYGYVRRTLAELTLPFAMLRGLWASPLREIKWDGIIWYAPSIFFGPLIWWLKRRSNCPTYLILRDIFPEWAVDLGLLRKGPVYYFFKLVANFQYKVADCIGVQTPSNLEYLSDWQKRSGGRLEVLQNWLAEAPNVGSTISIADSVLADRNILVYVGNMGVAQGTQIFIELAYQLKHRKDLGFLFVGRGSDVPDLIDQAREYQLDNTLFQSEIDASEIPGLLSQCTVGLLALSPKHDSHNIPGKFLTYLQAGLPVLARVNHGTDLVSIIENEGVGRVYTGDSIETLRTITEDLLDDPEVRWKMSRQGQALAVRMFSPATAYKQILASLLHPAH